MVAMDKPGELGWWGRLNLNQDLVMTGSIVPLDGGRYDTVRYSKTLLRQGPRQHHRMHSDATCKARI